MDKRLVVQLLLLAQCGCISAFTGFHQTRAVQQHQKLERSSKGTVILGYSRSSRDGDQAQGTKFDTSLPSASIESSNQDPTRIFSNGTTFLDLDLTAGDSWMVSSTASTPQIMDNDSNMVENLMSSYWGPRILLAAVACLYGTNFP
eukprot:CAMPEP_0117080542 /NCGR_PEP_ID=MMETSP0472-20121206/56819_1 /TAXON_ID=693140 ORGANISM="Tiarina fusus, Strain LIS" /NCGR_SAMPLE_ID=MMETSP0472 /ASSEMBLY_ACC=CAM_ASM_000603 /LENGTH=145 /DNA_ID=CAMNT_0004808209 /DNA_START=94 /DNA_END=527 /DNA_ORIENTATION=+